MQKISQKSQTLSKISGFQTNFKVEILHHLDKRKIDITRLILSIEDSNFICTLHYAHCTIHISQCTLQYALEYTKTNYISPCKLYVPNCDLQGFIMHISQNTLNYAHDTMQISRCMSQNAHCIIHIFLCTLHYVNCNTSLHYFDHYKMHIALCTLHEIMHIRLQYPHCKYQSSKVSKLQWWKVAK